jgi:hypothetical protein
MLLEIIDAYLVGFATSACNGRLFVCRSLVASASQWKQWSDRFVRVIGTWTMETACGFGKEEQIGALSKA